MSNQPPYEEIMAPVARRLSEARWGNARIMALGGAGFSAALVFLLMQIGFQSCVLKISFFCASIAIPVWLALWQYGDTYSFYGKESYGHFVKLKGSGRGLILFVAGGLLLLTSFTTLIWSFSVITSIAFAIVSFFMIILIYKHSNDVRKYIEDNDTNKL